MYEAIRRVFRRPVCSNRRWRRAWCATTLQIAASALSLDGFTDRRQVVFTRFREQQAAVESSKQLHAETGFKALDLLADGSGRHREFVGCPLETQVACGCLERTQAVEWRKPIAHHARLPV